MRQRTSRTVWSPLKSFFVEKLPFPFSFLIFHECFQCLEGALEAGGTWWHRTGSTLIYWFFFYSFLTSLVVFREGWTRKNVQIAVWELGVLEERALCCSGCRNIGYSYQNIAPNYTVGFVCQWRCLLKGWPALWLLNKNYPFAFQQRLGTD